MKQLVAFFLVLLAAVLVGLLAYQDPGYVLIGRGHTTIEMSLSLFTTLFIVGFVLLYLLIRFVLRTWHMPETLRQWRQHRRDRKARHALRRGLIELSEGHWKQAERALIRYVKYSHTPLLNYLSAARAAQKQNAHERRDHYLAMAMQSMPDADVAVELTQAELQLAHGQLEQSLATLEHLRSMTPHHTHVLLLLSQLYQQLQSWGDLKELLPLLRKYKVLDDTALQTMTLLTYQKLLVIAARQGDAEKLQQYWQGVPKDCRRNPELLSAYVDSLIKLEQHDVAEKLLHEALRHEWNPEWVKLYGRVKSSLPDKQLATAEGWLKGHENNAQLLLTLGRLSLHNQLWGKARAYLEASIGNAPRPDSYKELGLLLEQLEDKGAAAECYRNGLLLATADNPDSTPTVNHS
ncbi:MAG: heme biosynthesis protein HemY [Proteobacteria bacterium]|jgi:HemY protein|nr:heme biosynthesis protein HemY [Pseudomonadota bacterium]